MADGLDCKTKVKNDYLGEEREIYGSSPAELRVKAQALLERWAELEKKSREREEAAGRRELAALITEQARQFTAACQNLLRTNLKRPGYIDWSTLYDDRPYPPFVHEEPPPAYEKIARQLEVPPKKPLVELFCPSARRRRMALEEQAQFAFKQLTAEYEKRREEARSAYELKRAAYISEQTAYNHEVEKLHLAFEKGEPWAVECLMRIALSRLAVPPEIDLSFAAAYDRAGRLAAVECLMPAPWELPRVARCDYRAEEDDAVTAEIPDEEWEAFYSSLLIQIALCSVRAVFLTCGERLVSQAVFNGRVLGMPENFECCIGAGGTCGENREPEPPCIISLRAPRDFFQSILAAGRSPKECFLALKGRMSEPATAVIPVQPYLEIEKIKMFPAFSPQNLFSSPGRPFTPYRPGEIEKAGRELVRELLENIEEEISKSEGRPPRHLH